MRILKLFIFFAIMHQVVIAQQDAQFTHYMYNMSIINPAYTANEFGDVRAGALHRSQWVGLEGNPTSSMAFGQVMLENNIQVGFSFINDNVGDLIGENNIFIDGAYKLQVSQDSYLSFGTKLGVRFFNANLNNLNLESGDSSTDVAFQNNINRQFINVGFGLFYNTQKFYAGFSIPNLLETKYLENSDNSIKTYEQQHAFLTGGYIFNLNNNLKIKPSFLAKGVRGAPLSIDINTNVLIKNKVEVGLSYRIEDALATLVSFNISDNLNVGYSYDYNLSRLNNFNSGSHEIILLYKVNRLFNGYDKSPRFF